MRPLSAAASAVLERAAVYDKKNSASASFGQKPLTNATYNTGSTLAMLNFGSTDRKVVFNERLYASEQAENRRAGTK